MPDSQPEKKARSLQSSDGWTWKVENRRQNVGLKLLYEPGNWGDVLKGTWALEIAGELTRRARQQPLRFLDPFAGAATYPLTDSAARRLAWLGECEFTRAQGPWTATGRIASTGLLVRAAATVAGHGIAMDVFDADAERLEAWGDVPEARRLALRSGEEALRDPA
ncbi:MAG: hypothetical protein JXA90_03905, partial [Planctomycetes bacterium]|nr:hypothetical protein [Planctomycetota bacterium]